MRGCDPRWSVLERACSEQFMASELLSIHGPFLCAAGFMYSFYKH